jgi:hypothetical protein
MNCHAIGSSPVETQLERIQVQLPPLEAHMASEKCVCPDKESDKCALKEYSYIIVLPKPLSKVQIAI